MTKEEYLDHLGDLVDSKKEGCYGVESIWYSKGNVGVPDNLTDEEDFENWDEEDFEYWEDGGDIEDKYCIFDSYTYIMYNLNK